MQHIHNRSCVQHIADAALRDLVRARFDAVEEPLTVIVVEAGDDIEALETASGCPIVSHWRDDTRLDDDPIDDDFLPMTEWIADHGHCYEMLYLMTDDGAATVLWVPKIDGVDPTLLKLCADHRS